MVIEDLFATQSKLQTIENKLAESMLMIKILILEKNLLGSWKKGLLKESTNPHFKIFDNEDEALSLHVMLTDAKLIASEKTSDVTVVYRKFETFMILLLFSNVIHCSLLGLTNH